MNLVSPSQIYKINLYFVTNLDGFKYRDFRVNLFKMSQTPLGNHIGMFNLFLKKQFMETD